MIDWFTIIAQIINFFILLWILKYFLFNRIIQAMDKRAQNIRVKREEAEKKTKEMEVKKKEYEEKKQKLEEEKNQILINARKEADEEKKRLLEESNKEVQETKEKWLTGLKEEKKNWAKETRAFVGKEIFLLSRKVLKDLGNQALEEQLLNVFLNQLSNLNPSEREEFKLLIHENSSEVKVLTSFELSNEMKKRIEKKIKELNGQINIRYKKDPSLGIGIEIQTEAKRAGWNINQYLDQLEKQVEEKIARR